MPKFLPTVKFDIVTPDSASLLTTRFLVPGKSKWDWSKYIYKFHPELKDLIKGLKTEKTIYRKCYTYLSNFIDLNKKDLVIARKTYQADWDKINDKFLKVLSQHFQTEWPTSKKMIKASVSIIPICPRYLDNWSFNVFYRGKSARKTACHEIIHFLYFKKWLEVFPETERREMDTPFLVW